jgi:hypothetical protein
MSTLPVVVTASNTSGLTTTANAVINVNDVAPVSLFTTQTPAQPSLADTPSPDYELGMKFSASVNGTITGIRHWKATSETGTHTGRIWSSAGAQLASVAFTGESVSGWQTMSLATPLNITAGTQYVVSVNVNARYAATTSGFGSAISNGGLTAPIGAGVFNGTPGSFPTSSYSNSNYFRDVVFVPGSAPPLQAPVVNNGSFGVIVPASAGAVGTMSASNNPTSWAITAGNSAGYFSINSAGVISTTAAIVAGNYSLTVSATNAAGSGTGTASINAAASTGFPDASNTGPRAGTTFTDFTGDLVITTNGAVVSGRRTTGGSIIVNANNVTVTDCIVNCSGRTAGIVQGDGRTGLLVQYCEVFGDGGPNRASSHVLAGIHGKQGFEAAFNEIYGCENAFINGNGYIHDNYAHDFANWPSTADDHTDGIQTFGFAGNGGLRVIHNTFIGVETQGQRTPTNYASTSSCIALSQDMFDVTIENNFFAGGSYTLYGNAQAGGSPVNTVVRNNRFSRAYFPAVGLFGTHSGFASGAPGFVWTGNVIHETGATVGA